MVLDPMSAVALASSVIQFVEFASKLISKTYEYHESTDGTLAENKVQRTIASNLSNLSVGLEKSLEPFDRSRKWSTNETGLQKVTIECHEVANQLQRALNEFELGNRDRASFLRSFRLALTALWGKQEMERLQRRLNEAREQVMIHLMVVVCERQSKGLSSMRDDQAQTETAILTAIQASQNDLREQLLILSKSLSRTKNPGTQAIVAGWQAQNQAGIDAVMQTLTQQTENVERNASVHMYLDSLYFPQMEERKFQVREAHKKTFKWVFDGHPTEPLWKDLATWLRSPDQKDSLYWVTGKPGSGKSTLMRYLLDDERTKEYLQVWAGDRKLLLADCFFWNPGTKIQKSQNGLLRSLLHGLLKQSPNLIPVVSPWRWRSYDFGAVNMEPWSDGELTRALHACVKAAAAENLYIFLFVDGLDEFEGLEDARSEIVAFLQQISRCENVKICVSSRPWRIYEDAFEKNSKLLLQDLTREDISLYINDMLDESSHFQRFKCTDPATSSKLQTEVAKKSQGVFLWVFLVVRSLLQGLRDRDHVSVLMRRLEEIPSDLNAFFKQMLTQIEEAYRPQAAAMFQVAIAEPDEQMLTLMMLSFLDEQDPDFGLKMSVKAAAEPEVQGLLHDTAIRLKVRCKDFLEVRKIYGRGLFTTHTVEFLHRTVRDFLHTSEVEAILAGFSRKQETDVDYYLVNAMLAQVKMLRLQGGPVSASASSMADFVDLGHRLVRHTARRVPKNRKEVRQELEKVMREHKTTYGSVAWHVETDFDSYFDWMRECNENTGFDWIQECNASDAFLACAAAWGMREYVVCAVGNKMPRLAHPLLYYAVAGVWLYTEYSDEGMLGILDPEMVGVVLELGADPNEFENLSTKMTIWGRFLYQLEARRLNCNPETLPMQAYLQTAEHLIRHGAARKVAVIGFSPKIPADDILRQIFGEREAKRLEGLWPRKNLTRRPLMKKLIHSFSKVASGKKISRDSKNAP